MVFGSRESMDLNREIFGQIRTQSERASEMMSRWIDQPEWCEGTGRVHTHLTAVAPTLSNSLIAGEVSPGIEPHAANSFTRKTAKGTFYVRNPTLRVQLAKLGMDTEEVWNSITVNQGSVQHLDIPQEIKDVFRTASEINQMDVVRLAAQRQVFLEQAQSINLFFPADVSPQFFNQVHLEAYESGIKSLYYVRSQSVLQADAMSRVQSVDCAACDG